MLQFKLLCSFGSKGLQQVKTDVCHEALNNLVSHLGFEDKRLNHWLYLVCLAAHVVSNLKYQFALQILFLRHNY